ncbi:MAG: hypothetical protein ACRD6N_16390 [Pyrinomonadaceae bacterium]
MGDKAVAQQQDFSKVEIKVTKVSGNIYMLEERAETSSPRWVKTESLS